MYALPIARPGALRLIGEQDIRNSDNPVPSWLVSRTDWVEIAEVLCASGNSTTQPPEPPMSDLDMLSRATYCILREEMKRRQPEYYNSSSSESHLGTGNNKFFRFLSLATME